MYPALSKFVNYWKGNGVETITGAVQVECKGIEETMTSQEENNNVGSLSPSEDSNVGEVTAAMEEEEKALHEVSSKEQQAMRIKAEQEWESVEDEKRMLRLMLLLEKSQIYCDFLLKKMENQKVEAEKKQEKLEKKRNQKDGMQMVPQVERRISTRGHKKLNGVVETSPQRKKTVSNRKTGRKRKAEDSSSYMICNYLDKESLTKRCKVSEDSKNAGKESSSTLQEPGCSSSSDESKSTTQPRFVTGGELRPYQLKGLAWLKVLYENGMNGILADEMGLGKTLQCISLLAHFIEMGVRGPYLVAAPLSTLNNWVREFQKFSPKIPVLFYHGSYQERLRLRGKLRKLVHVEGEIYTLPVVVTSYEICMRDQKTMHDLNWKYLIVDEGHRIKNLNCKLIRELKTYKTANRLLLTGTPLQNNLSELWSLLNFLLPDIFDDLDSFQSWFDFSALSEDGGNEKIIQQEREHQVLQRLHAILTPFLLRRLKTEVELSLPPKKEVLVYAPLTEKQQTLYKACLDKTLPDIVGQKKKIDDPVEFSSTGRRKRKSRQEFSYSVFFNGDEVEMQNYLKEQDTNRNVVASTSSPSTVVSVNMNSILTLLRKCCNHPYLIECPLEEGTLLRKVDEQLVTSSGKMMMLDQMLPKLIQREHKVLIFSQWTSLMDILEDYCIMRNFGYSRLDGQMKIVNRQEEIAKFESNPSVRVFLLSTRAGGLGLNLAMADTVIIYDSDWNPQMDLQAQDRCHRIGQTKPVVVYRFVTANTVDQKIVERAGSKRKLEKMIIHKGKFKGNRDTGGLETKDLRELLEMSDHHKVVSSDGLLIKDQDLMALLDRSDLVSKASPQRKSGRPKRGQEDNALFRVLAATDIPASE